MFHIYVFITLSKYFPYAKQSYSLFLPRKAKLSQDLINILYLLHYTSFG